MSDEKQTLEFQNPEMVLEFQGFFITWLLVQLINGRNYTKKLIKISEFSTPGKTQLRSNPLTFQNALYYNFSCSM